MIERKVSERLLNLLRPFAANWTGSLGRGDLVIPQREIPRLLDDIMQAMHEATDGSREVGEMELFEALREARRLASVQDQAAELRGRFRILRR